MPAPSRSRLTAVLGPVLAVLAGSTMAVQSRVNALLGDRLGDPVAAALVSFLVGLCVVAAASALTGAGRRGAVALPARVRQRCFPWWFLLAGSVGAFFVLTQTLTVGVLGVSVLLLAVVVGQSLGGLAVDRWGIGPGGARPLTGRRVLGTALVVAAVVLAVSPRLGAGAAGVTALVLLPLLAGVLMPAQTAMNSRIGAAVDTPLTPTLTNFLAGAAALGLATAIHRAVTDSPPWMWPGPWWLWTGGAVGVVFVAAGTVLARWIGVLQTSLGLVTGMLLGGLTIDLLLPAPGTVVAPLTVVGTLLTLVGLAVVSWPGGGAGSGTVSRAGGGAGTGAGRRAGTEAGDGAETGAGGRTGTEAGGGSGSGAGGAAGTGGRRRAGTEAGHRAGSRVHAPRGRHGLRRTDEPPGRGRRRS